MPSVTEILAPWSNFDGVPPDVLAAAADRGSRVHAACYAYVTGLWHEPGEDARPYVDAFKKWFDGSVVEVVGAEMKLNCQMGSAFAGLFGHPDLIVKMKGEKKITLIDIKTPAALNPIWNVQLAAYKELAHENGIVVDRVAILRLKKDGGYIFTEIRDPRFLNINGFVKAYDAWIFFNALKGK